METRKGKTTLETMAQVYKQFSVVQNPSRDHGPKMHYNLAATDMGRKDNQLVRIVQQKMHAEILRVKVRIPRAIELYSASYISFYCGDIPNPQLMQDQPSTSRMLSPVPSSPGDSEELIEEKHRLWLQLKQCKDSLQEKTGQFWKKSELFINCQKENMIHLFELTSDGASELAGGEQKDNSLVSRAASCPGKRDMAPTESPR